MRDASPDARFRELAILAFALALGPTLFAALVLGLDVGTEAVDGRLLTPIWIVTAVTSVLGAWMLWRGRVREMLPDLGARVDRGRVETGRLRVALIILWAVLEGQALFGVTVYYLTLDPVPLAGLPIAWVGIFLTRPRRDWFGR